MAKPSLSELLAQKAVLDKQIAETQRAERTDAVAQVRTLMMQYGLTLADIGAKAAAAPRNAPVAKPTGGTVSKGRKGSTGKVAAKYRDKTTGQTWSGRGLQPNWLKAALAGGRPLSEFVI